jgi:hypothetical protein
MDINMDHAMQHSPNGAGHEQSEISVRTVIVSLAVLLVGAFLVCLLVVGIFRYFHTENKVAQTAKDWQQQIPPEPRVEEHPAEQLVTVRARENHVLSTYAWLDQKEGTVRIPIDKAIDKLAQQGLPSHDYLADIQAGKKPPTPKGSTNVVK